MKADSGIVLSSLKVDGGASANNYLLQAQADISRSTVVRPRCVETTAMGAAYLAGLHAGIWKTREDIASSWGVDREYIPAMAEEEKEKLASKWHKAVKMCAGWAKD